MKVAAVQAAYVLMDQKACLAKAVDLLQQAAAAGAEIVVFPEVFIPGVPVWIDRRYVPAGYGWSFPARDELRIGIGSFDPRFHVKDTTVLLADDLERPPVRYQGNWIPHKLRPGTEVGVPLRSMA